MWKTIDIKVLIQVTLFLLIISITNAAAQSNLNEKVNKWSNGVPEYRVDISSIFYYENCSYLGVFGKNNYKINIRFDTVWQKEGARNYFIEGKSFLNGKICSLEGELTVNHLELMDVQPDISELTLVATGTYKLTEKEGGIFTGNFRKYFSYQVGDGSPFKEINEETGDREGFAGVWTDSSAGKEYACYFGFKQYPEALTGDFDAGGEPNIDPKYKTYGWANYFEKRNGFAYYNNIECDDIWWE